MGLDRGLCTKREMGIVQIFVTVGKDRSTMKTKVGLEREKARKDHVEGMLRPAIVNLMRRAEAGRDLGPKGSDPEA